MRWNVIVLAAGRGPDDPMAAAYGVTHKCLVEVGGIPMLRRVVDTLQNHPAMFVSLNSLGSLVLDVNGSRLDATFIDQAGVRRDYFTVVKGSAASSSPFGGTPVAVPGTIQAETWLHHKGACERSA